MNPIMKLAIEKAKETMNQNLGGPFGAAIIDEAGNLIEVSSNTVIGDKDPTAHAEVNVIRKACKKLGTHDLKGYVLYTTAYPCPMCLSAIIWSNISKVYFGCTAVDAEEIGFRDQFIYDFIKTGAQDKSILELVSLDREACHFLFQEYKEKGKEIY